MSENTVGFMEEISNYCSSEWMFMGFINQLITGRNHLVEEMGQNWRKTTQLLLPCSFLVVALNFEAADFDMSGMQMPRIGDSCAAIWDDAYQPFMASLSSDLPHYLNQIVYRAKLNMEL